MAVKTVHSSLEYQRVRNEIMLSRKELGVIYTVINLACSCGCIPCDFSFTKVRMELSLRVTRSKFKLVFCFFNLFVSIFNLVYIVIRLYQVYRGLKTKESTAEDLAICCMYIICRVGHVLLNLTVVGKRKDFP